MEKIEQIFTFINKKTEELEKTESSTYLESVLTTLKGILDGKYELPFRRQRRKKCVKQFSFLY